MGPRSRPAVGHPECGLAAILELSQWRARAGHRDRRRRLQFQRQLAGEKLLRRVQPCPLVQCRRAAVRTGELRRREGSTRSSAHRGYGRRRRPAPFDSCPSTCMPPAGDAPLVRLVFSAPSARAFGTPNSTRLTDRSPRDRSNERGADEPASRLSCLLDGSVSLTVHASGPRTRQPRRERTRVHFSDTQRRHHAAHVELLRARSGLARSLRRVEV